MDYKELLALAEQKQNAINAFRLKKTGQSRLNQGPAQSAIAAFKARKEREEHERLIHARREKEHLLSLRAQNSKSLKKSKAMQMRTKDNDFSKISISEGEARDQEKMEEKIRKKGVKGKKERVKARIEMDQKLSGLTRRDRERLIAKMEQDEPIKVIAVNKKPKIAEIIANSKSVNGNKTQMSSPKRPPQPTLTYNELLNLAKEKSQVKVSLEDHIKSVVEASKQLQRPMTTKEKEASKELQRPMTAKEKERHNEERFFQKRVNKARLPTAEEIRRNNLTNKRKEPESEPEPYDPKPLNPSKGSKDPTTTVTNKTNQSYIPNMKMDQRIVPSVNGRNGDSNTYQPSPLKNVQPKRMDNQIPSRVPNTTSNSTRTPPIDNKRTDRERMPPPSSIHKKIASGTQLKSRPTVGSSRLQSSPPPYEPKSSSKNSYKSEVRNGSQMYRPRAYSPPPQPANSRLKLPPIGASYRRGMYPDYEPEIEDEEDEYDEEEDDEMADFIDDGPEYDGYDDEPEYSKAIRQMFNYDKRRYCIEDDDDIEEASFSQCMKEEKASLRAGIQEDLEDMQREEEEERAKAARRKAKLKANRR